MSRVRRLEQLTALFPGQGPPTNPATRHPVQRLKYIGSLLASRLVTQYNVNTLQQLLTYMRAHTRRQNQAMLTATLLNPKARRCELPARRMRPAPCPCTYHVRDINRMGYNAILYYALRRNVPLNRIPTTHRARTARQAYPDAPCGTRRAPRTTQTRRRRQPHRAVRRPTRRQPSRTTRTRSVRR